MSPNPQETADLVTFAEEILNGKLFFCAVISMVESNETRVGKYRNVIHKKCRL